MKMVKLWMSILALLVATSQGYRAPLYYGRRPTTFGVVDGVASTQHMPLVNSNGLLLEEDMGYNDRNNYASYVPQDRDIDHNLRYADGYNGMSRGRNGYVYGLNEPYRNRPVNNYYSSGGGYGSGYDNYRGDYGYNNNQYYYNNRYNDYDDYYDNGYGSSGSSYGPYNDGYRGGRRRGGYGSGYNNYRNDGYGYGSNYNNYRNDGYGYGSSYNNRARYSLPASRD